MTATAEGHTAGGDASALGGLDLRLDGRSDPLGIAAVGEQQHVLEVDRGGPQRWIGLAQADVHIDSAASRTHAADGRLDRLLVLDRPQRNAPPGAGVDVQHAQVVAGAEQGRRASSSFVGELELAVGVDPHGHRSRDVDDDDLGQAGATAFLLEVEGHRRDVLEGCSRIAAGPEALIPAQQK